MPSRYRYILAVIFIASSPVYTEDAEFRIFEVRNDLAYVEAKLSADYFGKTGRIYKPGVPLPSATEGDKKTTSLLIGSAPIAAVEKDYLILKIPAELKGQVARGDIIKIEGWVPGEPEVKPDSSAAITKRNYIFGAGTLLANAEDRKFRLGELGYQRHFDGNAVIGNLAPEVMSLEFRPVWLSSPGFEKTALAMFYKFSFLIDRWLILNTGIQFGLDKTGSVGGGLFGIGFAFRQLLRFELNVDWLFKSYTDSHVKLSIPLSKMTTVIVQSGVLSLNGTAYRTDTYGYPVVTTTTTAYEKSADLTYFTLGAGFTLESNVRLMMRAGVAGEKLDTIGLIGRAEIGFLF